MNEVRLSFTFCVVLSNLNWVLGRFISSLLKLAG